MNILKGTVLLVLSFITFSLNAQENTNKPNQTKTVTNFPFEKVYLLLDRSHYVTGDDIWFKAYLTDAFSNKLFDNSNCLYVELITPDFKIIQRNSIKLEKGLGYGDFHLKDSLAAGTYQIRAYTNWMQNFGESFFFKKEIRIDNLSGIKGTDNQIKTEKQLDLQFFPEGGSLVDEVYSVVAFKAINSSGLGVDIKGTVFSSNGDSITSFESSHLGMGYFNLIPKSGISYYASGTDKNGIRFKLALPASLKTGYTLKISEMSQDKIKITIKTNAETLSASPNQEMVVAGISHGTLCVTAKTIIKKQINLIAVPKTLFPEGIARITLFDTTGKAYCERLIYISGNNKIHIRITPDKKIYAPRQKVTVQISVKDSANKPIAANLALSAIDENYQDAGNQTNIASYLLLESEIQGHIEQPSWYFDTTAINRSKALDILLLTQGWRDFVWKHLSDSTIKMNYYMEKGISISGKLRRLFVNKPIANANISMGLLGGTNPQVCFTQTDSSGIYYFDGLDFTGQRTVIVSASNKNHRTQGWISLDSLFGEPAPVNPFWIYKPNANPNFIQEEERRHNILKKYRLTDTIELNEVVVKGKKTDKKTDDGNFRMYGSPDYSIDVTDQMTGYSDIFQLLQGRVAGLTITGTYPNLSFSSRGSRGEPLFLLDGTPVDIEFIATLSVTEVDKVEVLKNGASSAIFGMRGGNGVISVFTKHGYASSPKAAFHSINQKITGYYQSRTFYSPNYDTKVPDNEKPDLRSTIYWQANIVTDAGGNATVTFIHSDSKTPVNIIAEGITNEGVPLVGKSGYTINDY
jgi:TonB-dependent SusC/RagA subfamily outer membrane receptor